MGKKKTYYCYNDKLEIYVFSKIFSDQIRSKKAWHKHKMLPLGPKLLRFVKQSSELNFRIYFQKSLLTDIDPNILKRITETSTDDVSLGHNFCFGRNAN